MMPIRSRAAAAAVHILTALCAAVGVVLQCGFIGGKLNLAVLQYFTLMSNILCAVYFTGAAVHTLRRGGTWLPVCKGPFFEDFIEGWRWTLRRHTLMAICVIAALVNFGLNGVFAAVNLQLVSTHVDSVRLGFVNTVMGVGMLIGAVIAARVCERVHMGTGLVVLSVTSLLTLLPMLFSSDYLVILASSLVVGLPIPTINSLLMGFVFAKVPSEMQGRVGSASDMLSMIPTLFCSALAGSLLPRIGFGATIGLFLAVLAVNVVIALLMPSIRSLPAADHWDDASL